MKRASLSIAVLSTAMAGSALSQTQISGISKCPKPDTLQTIEVGDQSGHVLSIAKELLYLERPNRDGRSEIDNVHHG